MPTSRVGRHADVVGHDHARLADAEVDLERHVAGGQVGLAQVDDELADAELVAVAQVGRRGRPVVAVAHAAVEVDARGRHRARRQRERHRRQDQPADRAQERAEQDRRAGGDDHDRDDGLAARGRGPGAADGDQSAEDEDADAERGALGDVARVAAGSLSGDEPPDEDTGGDQNGEREEDGPRGEVRRREERAR